METGYKVCDAMTKKPVTVSPGTSIQECAKIMHEQHVGALLVKDADGLAGIVTEQDIVRKSVLLNDKPSLRTAADVMEKKMHTVEPEKDIFEALMSMREMNIRHLPVVSNDEMIGLLTIKDILKIQPQLFDLLVEKFEIREEENKPVNNEDGDDGVCQVCGSFAKKLYEKDGAFLCLDCSQ